MTNFLYHTNYIVNRVIVGQMFSLTKRSTVGFETEKMCSSMFFPLTNYSYYINPQGRCMMVKYITYLSIGRPAGRLSFRSSFLRSFSPSLYNFQEPIHCRWSAHFTISSVAQQPYTDEHHVHAWSVARGLICPDPANKPHQIKSRLSSFKSLMLFMSSFFVRAVHS